MERTGAPRGALARIRHLIGAAVVAAAAVVMATAAGTGTTHAAWNDATTVALDNALGSGTPGLSVSGFENLDFEYEPLALSTSATITVANTGNTALHSFEATRSVVSGSSDLASAITLTFTGGGQTNVDLDTWLSGLTLAPGASVQYTATTTLPALDLVLHALTEVQLDIEVEATAGTSWNLLAVDGFSQGVLEPPSGRDDFNFTIVWPVPWPDSGTNNFGFMWAPSFEGTNLSGSSWLIFTDGYEVSEDHGTYPQYSMHPGEIDHADWPAVGQTRQIVITVLPDISGWTTPIAQLTVWMTNVDNSYALFFLSDPTAASASLPYESAPAAPELEPEEPVVEEPVVEAITPAAVHAAQRGRSIQ